MSLLILLFCTTITCLVHRSTVHDQLEFKHYGNKIYNIHNYMLCTPIVDVNKELPCVSLFNTPRNSQCLYKNISLIIVSEMGLICNVFFTLINMIDVH